MIRSNLFVSCAFAAILVLAAAPAWADSVSVANASFETTNTLSSYWNGLYYQTTAPNAIPGWNSTGLSGSWQPTTVEFTSIPNGTTIAYTNAGTISQDLTGIGVLPNDTYTLSVFVGNRLDGYGMGSFTISLDAGSSTLCSFVGNSNNIAKGTFVDETCTYQSGSVIPPGDLTIVLSSSPNSQLFVDNVSVTTPEPGSLALLTAGIGFLFFVARRRKLQLPVTA